MSPADAEARRFGPYDYALTAEEFAALARAVAGRQRAALERRMGWRWIVAGAVAAGIALGVGLALAGAAARVAAAAGLAVAGSGVMLRWVFRRQIARAQGAAVSEAKADAALYKHRRRLVAGAEGLSLDGASTPWSAIGEVSRVEGMVTLWRGLADAIVAPARAFADADEAARFEAFARAMIAQAGGDGDVA
ncbi:MAG: hypothetical protein IPL88_05270 [Rhizobiales bacterium]|nr:hypothetical protein [Hyphomicrobiales bacterium]